ncbi:MAG: hypothetical protein IJ752_06435 [Alphaproteobacteria bacterium]|nr:hypothetical protein [Alphaproteobacteria bacterium]
MKLKEYGRPLLTLTVLFWIILFLINFGHGAGWSGVYSILIKKIGSDSLSYFFLFSALGSFVLNLLLMFFADVFSSEKLVQISFAGFILILVADLSVLESQGLFSETLFKSVLIFLAVFIISVPSVFIIQTWNLINKTFTPKSAADIYPLLSTAPLIGSISGGFAANRLPKYFVTQSLVITWGVCILIAIITTAVLTRLLKKHRIAMPPRTEKINPEVLLNNFKEGFYHYKKSAFALNLSIIFMSFWLVCTIIDFCYAQTLDKTYTSSEEMASFYGGYTTVANITALLLQTFLGSKLLKITGVRSGFLFLPCSQILCFIMMILSPGLYPIVGTMFAQTLIGMSIQSNSVQVSFNVFSRAVRGKIRTLLEGVLNPLGGIIGSVMIIVIGLLKQKDSVPLERILPYTGILFSAVWLLAAIKIHRSYIQEAEKTAQCIDPQDQKEAQEALAIEREAADFWKKHKGRQWFK